MKRIFRKRSIANDLSSFESSPSRERSHSLPVGRSYEVLHMPHGSSFREPLLSTDMFASSAGSLSRYRNGELDPLDSDLLSMALSETQTLFEEKRTRLRLQETYLDNFTHYLPFLLLRQRLTAPHSDDVAQGPANTEDPAVVSHGDTSNTGFYDSGDDLPTMIDEPLEQNDTMTADDTLLSKPLANFNVRREFIIANEIFKGSSFLFPSNDSYNQFKELRSHLKRDRKNLTYVYDKSGAIKMQANGLAVDANDKVDERQHLVPLRFKIKGQGLPLLKFHVPYMQSFRRSTPFVIFKRYKEIPGPPEVSENTDVNNPDNDFETYTYCTVNSKYTSELRRYIFSFSPAGQEEFQVLVYQHNFKPFADFNYKGSRFRVIGTTLSSGYLTSYSPRMKLFVVDRGKPSLCDKLVDKKVGFELRSIVKKKSTTPEGSALYCGMKNPFPDPDCPLLDDAMLDFAIPHSQTGKYVPRSSPPFGAFLDSVVYDSSSNLLPKKYSEAGKFDFYQDGQSTQDSDLDSTLSVDADSLVLNCILITLREAGIRSATRGATSPTGIGTGLRMLSGFAGPVVN